MIQTKPFSIDRRGYTKAMFALLMKHVGWVSFGVCIAMGLILIVLPLSLAETAVRYGILVYLTLVPLALWFMAWHSVASRKNAPLADALRTMEFDDDQMRISTDTGVESKVPWSLVGSATLTSGWNFLRIGSAQYFPIPEEAFQSDADRLAFHELLRSKGLAKPA
jgi:hypothetical protein